MFGNTEAVHSQPHRHISGHIPRQTSRSSSFLSRSLCSYSKVLARSQCGAESVQAAGYGLHFVQPLTVAALL